MKIQVRGGGGRVAWRHSAGLNKTTQLYLPLQYPGVAKSIRSDVNNIMTALSLSNVLPRGNGEGEVPRFLRDHHVTDLCPLVQGCFLSTWLKS